MLWYYAAGQLLLLAQASFAVTSLGSPPTNSSEPLLHRSKRSSPFVLSPNCPKPVYLTQAQVSEWPGITVDTTPALYLDEITGWNTYKCSDDTFWVYMHLPTVLTRQNWWMVCDNKLRNGWRVTDANRRDTPYKQIPVGCIKPTCTGLQLFDGNESALTNYPTYQVVPNQPSIVGINQKFQFTCPVGSTIGFAASATTIILDATMKITCEAEGWWMRTKANLAGLLLSSKIGCIKLVAAPVVPTTCTGPALQLFDGSEPIIAANAATYQFIPTAPSSTGGKLVFVCPSGASIGYPQGDRKLSVEPLKVTCESTGWWVNAPNRVDQLLSAVRIGCFRELPSSATTAPVSSLPKTACGCSYEPSSCRTCDLQKLTVLDGVGLSGRCTLACAKDYIFEGGEVNMISCEQGKWSGSSRTVDNATVPMSGPFGYITTSCVPAPTPATCSTRHLTFDCVGCDPSKIIPLASSKSNVGCVLACDKGYRLLVQDANLKVIRAQEAVADELAFKIYPLGTVKNPIRINVVKFSCEPVPIECPALTVMGKAEFDAGPYIEDNVYNGPATVDIQGLSGTATCPGPNAHLFFYNGAGKKVSTPTISWMCTDGIWYITFPRVAKPQKLTSFGKQPTTRICCSTK